MNYEKIISFSVLFFPFLYLLISSYIFLYSLIIFLGDTLVGLNFVLCLNSINRVIFLVGITGIIE